MTIETRNTSYSGWGYNASLIEYPNGSAQIRLYDEPLMLKDNNEFREVQKIQEPFYGTYVREVEQFEPKIDPLESRRISLARTKRMISDYARSVSWEWFCTFTFSPEKVDRTDYKECCKKIRIWLKNIRDRKAKSLKYLAVPELHKDMESWHFHVLLAYTENLDFFSSGMIKGGKVIYNIPSWTHGFSTATKVYDTYRIQKYIVKYMTKACHAMSKGAHRYFVSYMLPKPKKSLFVIEKGEEEELIKNIVEKLEKKVMWVSHNKAGGYTGVTYIELLPKEKREGM